MLGFDRSVAGGFILLKWAIFDEKLFGGQRDVVEELGLSSVWVVIVEE
jgi:hypothetical protein